MARVFVDEHLLEGALALRAAIEADGHEVELVATAEDIQRRMAGASERALVLTGAPGEPRAVEMRGLFETEIPRPPVIAFTEDKGASHRRRLASAHDLDKALSLPVDPEEARVVLQTQLDRHDLQRRTGIIGNADVIHEMLGRIQMISPVISTVLVTGESGTGKELVARALHGLSSRRTRSFIAVNCAALPESLLESELFGHEKGSFTGATSRRQGMFELADGGTLLLDEIAEMPLATQTRLLRVLESHRFMRVGGDREIRVSVRVVAATNRDLRAAVEAGEFRRDLYYRLNVLHVDVPPLRERRRDIPLLVRHFIAEFGREHDRGFRGLAPAALDILMKYGWPGNVRELRNLIESMVVLAPGAVIQPEDIPAEIRSGSGSLLPVRPNETPQLALRADGFPRSPQMELVFRTLVELKVDMEDLKREFEAYRAATRGLPPGEGPGGGTAVEIDITDSSGSGTGEARPARRGGPEASVAPRAAARTPADDVKPTRRSRPE